MEVGWSKRDKSIELLKSLDLEVLAAAVECVESQLYAGKFLATARCGLGDKIPADVAKSAEGKRQVLNLVGRLNTACIFDLLQAGSSSALDVGAGSNHRR